jgi:hypothetical protein
MLLLAMDRASAKKLVILQNTYQLATIVAIATVAAKNVLVMYQMTRAMNLTLTLTLILIVVLLISLMENAISVLFQIPS